MILRDYQIEGRDQLREAYRSGSRRILYVLPTGGGKCLGKGTPVLMFDGHIKSVEEIVPGDRLIGPDSKPRTVVSICNGVEELYRITPTKGDAYIVNESHILSLRRTGESGNPQYPCERRAGEIVNVEVRDYLKHSNYWRHIRKGWRAAADFQQAGRIIMDPWFLGLWLGDGDSRHPSITSGDEEIENALRSIAIDNGLRLRVTPNSRNSKYYGIVSRKGVSGRNGGANPLLNQLRYYDLLQNKHIPHEYKTASREIRLELLAGIIDSDGSLGNKGYDLCLSNERLLDDVVFVARSLGFSAYKKPCVKMCCNNGVESPAWRTYISGDVDAIPCRVSRKKAQPRRQKKNVLNVGIKVEPIGAGEYFGFEIEGPDRLFLLGDFTVTHNTILFLNLARTAAANGRRVCICVHRGELLDQTARALKEQGIPYGLINPGHKETVAQIHVATIQTLARRTHWKFDLLILDEGHHAPAKQWKAVIGNNPLSTVLGVTATPCRLQGGGLSEVYDRIVIGWDTARLTDSGYLTRARVYSPVPSPVQEGLDRVATQQGDWVRKELQTLMDRRSITGCAIDHYTRLAPGKPAIAFCVDIKHAEHVSEQFRIAGYRSLSVDGRMTRDEQSRIIRGLSDGSIQVVTSCDLISEGVDVPVVTAGIMLRPTQSTALSIQQTGRCLRPVYAAGFDLTTQEGRLAAIAQGPKPRAIILDHVGNALRHGLPDEQRDWSLESGAAKREYTVWTCPQCLAAHRPAPVCPACGYEYSQKDKRKQNRKGLAMVDGELVELTSEERKRLVESCKTLKDFSEVARKLGYKQGWAWRKAEERRKYAGSREYRTGSRSTV